jgi:hypothetical protein
MNRSFQGLSRERMPDADALQRGTSGAGGIA